MDSAERRLLEGNGCGGGRCYRRWSRWCLPGQNGRLLGNGKCGASQRQRAVLRAWPESISRAWRGASPSIRHSLTMTRTVTTSGRARPTGMAPRWVRAVKGRMVVSTAVEIDLAASAFRIMALPRGRQVATDAVCKASRSRFLLYRSWLTRNPQPLLWWAAGYATIQYDNQSECERYGLRRVRSSLPRAGQPELLVPVLQWHVLHRRQWWGLLHLVWIQGKRRRYRLQCRGCKPV